MFSTITIRPKARRQSSVQHLEAPYTSLHLMTAMPVETTSLTTEGRRVVPITGIAIAFNNDNLFIDVTGPLLPGYTVGGHLFTIANNGDGTVSVGGVVTSTEIAVFGSTTYNAVEYTYEAGLSGKFTVRDR